MKKYINTDLTTLTKEDALEIIKTKRLDRIQQKTINLINKIIKELDKTEFIININNKNLEPADLLDYRILYYIHSVLCKQTDELLNIIPPAIDFDAVDRMIDINNSIRDMLSILAVLDKAEKLEKTIKSIETKLNE